MVTVKSHFMHIASMALSMKCDNKPKLMKGLKSSIDIEIGEDGITEDLEVIRSAMKTKLVQRGLIASRMLRVSI